MVYATVRLKGNNRDRAFVSTDQGGRNKNSLVVGFCLVIWSDPECTGTPREESFIWSLSGAGYIASPIEAQSGQARRVTPRAWSLN